MKIVFLGDSLTWGGYGGNFVSEVAKQLSEHKIINAGVGGDTVVNLLRRVDDVLDEHEPDAMFVMVGGNDAHSYSMPKTRGYYKKAKALEDGVVTPELYEETYRELLQRIQLNFVQPLLGVSPTEYSQEAIEAKYPYNNTVRQLADKMNIPLLDLDVIYTPSQAIDRDEMDIAFIQSIGANWDSGWDKFEEERAKWGYQYTFDGLHILPKMGLEFANHIVPFLREHVL